jgi:hypothetical protein
MRHCRQRTAAISSPNEGDQTLELGQPQPLAGELIGSRHADAEHRNPGANLAAWETGRHGV